MDRYTIADEKLQTGYNHIRKNETIEACDAWLSAWGDIKAILAEENIKDITELQEKYRWAEFLFNYVQDLEQELHNAGLENEEYFHKRIIYCDEMLKLCGKQDELLIENTKRAIADSHYEVGDTEECDRLYSNWLTEDPTWGWGYIGWSYCYTFGTGKKKPNYDKAEEIIRVAVDKEEVRDRIDVLHRALEIYTSLEQKEKVDKLKKEIMESKKSSRNRPEVNVPVKVVKVGRNDPCPCGSGKKNKKCCGNN
ncbi:MAG: SEC-C metal-binding domain-containing protein [Desulfitobacteriaceae bacterium]|nr:SEC-C metal-binding domain-containing protein [Desulfitobacteriaceae bacterium]